MSLIRLGCHRNLISWIVNTYYETPFNLSIVYKIHKINCIVFTGTKTDRAHSQLDCRVTATTMPRLSKRTSSITRNSLCTARVAPASSSRERALTATIFTGLLMATTLRQGLETTYIQGQQKQTLLNNIVHSCAVTSGDHFTVLFYSTCYLNPNNVDRVEIKRQVSFWTAIESVELMHEYCPQHFRM